MPHMNGRTNISLPLIDSLTLWFRACNANCLQFKKLRIIKNYKDKGINCKPFFIKLNKLWQVERKLDVNDLVVRICFAVNGNHRNWHAHFWGIKLWKYLKWRRRSALLHRALGMWLIISVLETCESTTSGMPSLFEKWRIINMATGIKRIASATWIQRYQDLR